MIENGPFIINGVLIPGTVKNFGGERLRTSPNVLTKTFDFYFEGEAKDLSFDIETHGDIPFEKENYRIRGIEYVSTHNGTTIIISFYQVNYI